jgi:GTP-binding protein Era
MHETEMNHKETLERIIKLKIPVLLIINKIDLADQEKVVARRAYWQEKVPNAEIIPVSALHKFNIDRIWDRILELAPAGPAYFDKEELSDRPMRFFVAEMIREKIFLHCDKEVPYACQVEIESYEEGDNITHIRALIIVERDSQKGILIGKKGEMLKRIGRESRLDMEAFIGQKIFLETFVKVDKDWRASEQKLKKYGY